AEAHEESGDGHSRIVSRARALLGRAVPDSIKRRVTKTYDALRNEQTVSKLLHPESQAALDRIIEKDPGLRERVENAYGYAIFPSVGKTSAVLGASYGLGEVFKRGRLIGYAAIVQLTLGVQLGGDTFTELVLFENEEALERFKSGKVGFAANASTVLVKAGAAASSRYKGGTAVFVSPEGGLLLELALGAQKFVFRPGALTRGKSLHTELRA
ncbi:MAG: hypothetical protein H5U40_02295, partial [Polyangiaceae bacterium]|nr:hypothetical protein [Polyangiaceae bacterium]